jgi:hypothetical protein
MACTDTLVWGLVAPLLAAATPADTGAARLACSELLAAVDGAQPITALRITPWPAESSQQHAPSARLQHSVTHVEANRVCSHDDWRALICFCSRLPRLTELHVRGRRTWLSWPPPPPQQQQQAPQLRATSFEGTVASLAELAALAPGLQRLQCHHLVLCPGSKQGAGSEVLPRATHLSVAGEVTMRVTDEGDAAEALAHALPALQVVSHLPRVRVTVSGTSTALSTAAAFARCSQLRAVRTFGSSTDMRGLPAATLARLPSLRRVVVFGCGPAEQLKGASGLTQLTTLSLTFACGRRGSHHVVRLLKELASLRQLQQLAIPAKVLCAQCCGSRTTQALADLLSACAQRPEHQLRELVFLVRAPAPAGLRHAGDFCPHAAPAGELRALVHSDTTALRSAVAAAAAARDDAAAASVAAVEAARAVKARQLCQHSAEGEAAGEGADEPFTTALVDAVGDPGWWNAVG